VQRNLTCATKLYLCSKTGWESLVEEMETELEAIPEVEATLFVIEGAAVAVAVGALSTP
jgi:hypothetical protein